MKKNNIISKNRCGGEKMIIGIENLKEKQEEKESE